MRTLYQNTTKILYISSFLGLISKINRCQIDVNDSMKYKFFCFLLLTINVLSDLKKRQLRSMDTIIACIFRVTESITLSEVTVRYFEVGTY